MSLPKLPQSDEIWPASALAVHQVMRAHIEKMSEQLEKLTSTVDELQCQLKLNSRTSSKPPSSDRERRPAKKKKKTGRAKGAQKGHKGSTRVLFEPDEVINYALRASEILPLIKSILKSLSELEVAKM